MRSLMSVAIVVLLLAAPAWALGDSSEAPATSPEIAAVAPGILYPMLPTHLTPPTYDYAAPETCAGCHYISAGGWVLTPPRPHFACIGRLASARRRCQRFVHDRQQPPSQFGVPYACCTGKGTGTCGDMWQLTGGGWFDSRHAQSDHGSTENGFCAKCHSPLQASASASFNSGAVVNAGPVPQQRFQAVTCATCHPPDNIVAQIGAMNPSAMDGGRIAIYLWKGYNNPASYQTLGTGNEPRWHFEGRPALPQLPSAASQHRQLGLSDNVLPARDQVPGVAIWGLLRRWAAAARAYPRSRNAFTTGTLARTFLTPARVISLTAISL